MALPGFGGKQKIFCSLQESNPGHPSGSLLNVPSLVYKSEGIR